MRILAISSLLCITLLSTGCMADPATTTDAIVQTDAPQAGDTIATIETNKGTIKIRLFPTLVPETVKNFTEHAKNGYYDGITFHRVIEDFMIQGGDPAGNGTGGHSYKGPGTSFNDEFHEKLTHHRGALSMANAGPNTNGSQFFIVHKEGGTHFLNNRHAVFGQVYEGMDVVDAIAKVDKDLNDKPKEAVTMTKVTIDTFK